MLQEVNIFPPYVVKIYTEGKFWLAIGAFFFAIFNGLSWIKSIKTNDLAHIQTGVEDLKKEMTTQTNSFVQAMEKNTKEITELRGDMKLIIGSLMTIPSPVLAAARRKK